MARKRKNTADGISGTPNQTSMDTAGSIANCARGDTPRENAKDSKTAKLKTEASDGPKKKTARRRGQFSGSGKKAGAATKRAVSKKMTKAELFDQYKNMEKQIKEIQAGKEALQQRLSRSEDKCTKFQKALHMTCKHGGTRPMTTKEISEELLDLRRQYHQWAQEYSAPGQFAGDEASFADALSSFQRSYPEFGTYEPLIALMKELDCGTHLVLTSFLAHFICKHVIDRPFFFLEQAFSGHWSGNLEMALNDFKTEIVPPGRARRIHAWVKHTLQMIESSDSQDPNRALEEIIRFKTESYSLSTRTFLKIVPSMTLRWLEEHEQKTREEALMEIMRGFGELCLKLRCQERQRQSIGIRCLKSELTKKEFERVSEVIQLHHAVPLKLSDGRLDGKLVTFVVEPAIECYWSISDQIVDEETEIWAPAVVVVEGWREVYHGPATVVPVAGRAQYDMSTNEDVVENAGALCASGPETEEQEPTCGSAPDSYKTALMGEPDFDASIPEQNVLSASTVTEGEDTLVKATKDTTI